MKNYQSKETRTVPAFEVGTAQPGRFIQGELYLYHPSDPHCPPESSLWGVFDRTADGYLLLESCSRDLFSFRCRIQLPHAYRYVRLASRDELRDYTAGLIYYECHIHEMDKGAL